MSDSEYFCLLFGFVVFLFLDLGLFLFEHGKLEKQHKKHLADLSILFDNNRFLLLDDLKKYFENK